MVKEEYTNLEIPRFLAQIRTPIYKVREILKGIQAYEPNLDKYLAMVLDGEDRYVTHAFAYSKSEAESEALFKAKERVAMGYGLTRFQIISYETKSPYKLVIFKVHPERFSIIKIEEKDVTSELEKFARPKSKIHQRKFSL